MGKHLIFFSKNEFSIINPRKGWKLWQLSKEYHISKMITAVKNMLAIWFWPWHLTEKKIELISSEESYRKSYTDRQTNILTLFIDIKTIQRSIYLFIFKIINTCFIFSINKLLCYPYFRIKTHILYELIIAFIWLLK